MFNRLKKLVKKESMLWGEDVASTYHAQAANHMDLYWKGLISPILSRHPIDFSRSADFATGYGRNAEKLLMHTSDITLIDVNQHNIDYCKEKFSDNKSVKYVLCNGYTIEGVSENSLTFLYTFDSMVHFSPKLLESYIPDFFRALETGGFCFIHHSNYESKTGSNFKQNPHWRNNMTKEKFAVISKNAGFEVVEQNVVEWGGFKELDCISVLRKPN